MNKANVEAIRQLVTTTAGHEIAKVIEAEIEEWKEELVDAEGVERDRLQGAIRKVRALLDEATRPVVAPEDNPNRPRIVTSY